MHLVYIGSQEEQTFLENSLSTSEDWWIGLSSISWLDGSSLDYENFSSSSSAFDDGGICYLLRAAETFQWIDRNCSISNRYICEKESGEFSCLTHDYPTK